MSQVRILSPRPKTKPAQQAGFVFGLGSRVRACEAGSAEASAQATPERRPVGRAKRVNPVAPTKNKTCLLGGFCFWIGKPGSSLQSRFSRSVSAGNTGTAPAAPDKPPKIHLSPHNSQRLWGVFSAKARVLFFPRQLPPAPELTKSQDFL